MTEYSHIYLLQDKLPPPVASFSNSANGLTPTQQLARLGASPAVKTAWEAAVGRSTPNASHGPVDTGEIRLLPASSPRRTSSQFSGGKGGYNRVISSPAASPGAESFVLLQDSAVQKIPNATISSRTPSSVPRRGQTASNSALNDVPNVTLSPASSDHQSSSKTPSTSANNLHSIVRLFTLISSRSDIDHPLCSECTSTLIEDLERKLSGTKRERDGYLAFEKDVRKHREAIAQNAADDKKLEHRIHKVYRTSVRFQHMLMRA